MENVIVVINEDSKIVGIYSSLEEARENFNPKTLTWCPCYDIVPVNCPINYSVDYYNDTLPLFEELKYWKD